MISDFHHCSCFLTFSQALSNLLFTNVELIMADSDLEDEVLVQLTQDKSKALTLESHMTNSLSLQDEQKHADRHTYSRLGSHHSMIESPIAKSPKSSKPHMLLQHSASIHELKAHKLHDLLNGCSGCIVTDNKNQPINLDRVKDHLVWMDKCLSIIIINKNWHNIPSTNDPKEICAAIENLLKKKNETNGNLDEYIGIYGNNLYSELYTLALKVRQMAIIDQHCMVIPPV